jgi:hypothetical protein
MPEQLIDTSQDLDAALAASLQSRRERLERAVRNQRLRMRVAFASSGLIAIFAVTALLAKDSKAAAFLAAMACVTFAFVGMSGIAARKRVAEALRELDWPK